MTLLTCVNEVCDVVSLDRFEIVIGSNLPNAQTMNELANLAGKEIANRGDWNRLIATSTIDVEPYPLPAAYDRPVQGGPIFSASAGFIRPVTNKAAWRVLQDTPSVTPFYFVEGNKVYFSIAGTGMGIALDYFSKNYVVHTVGPPTDTFTLDDDTVVFPERLLVLNMIWRWKRQKGLSYSDQLAEFEAAFIADLEADVGSS